MGKRLTIRQYVESKYNTDALTYNAATRRIRELRKLPKVATIEHFGRFILLHVK